MSASDSQYTLLWQTQPTTEVSVQLVWHILLMCLAYNNVYCTVHYVMFDIIDLNKYMYSIITFYCLYTVTGLTVSNPEKGSYWRSNPMKQLPGRSRRRWRPGTQAMREVQNYMRTRNLLIPKAPFLWYVFICLMRRTESVQYCTYM